MARSKFNKMLSGFLGIFTLAYLLIGMELIVAAGVGTSNTFLFIFSVVLAFVFLFILVWLAEK